MGESLSPPRVGLLNFPPRPLPPGAMIAEVGDVKFTNRTKRELVDNVPYEILPT